MNLTLDLLRRFTDLPDDVRAARVLMDEVGLEVKRIDPDAPGVPLTLELLANRGDHHALVGIATEVSGRTGAAVRAPEGLDLTVGDSPHPLVVLSDLCPVYTLTKLVRSGDGAALPAEATALLGACGLEPVHPVVDATNAVLKEIGQPTHAFDADTIEGPITVRTARAGETALPLFATERVEVPEGALVIADDVKILAIAGVIGCEESKTTERTTTVLLESAAFDPVSVRKTGRALGIHTDSSARFERGSDFSAPVRGAGRVAHLLGAAGWTVEGTTGVHSTWTDPRRTIPFEPEAARRFLAIDEDDAAIVARLRRYGLHPVPDAEVSALGTPARPGGLRILVPPHRLWDVEHPADLYEELAKSIGYDNTPVGLPPIDLGALPTAAERARDGAAEVLVGAGFLETITDGFHGRSLPEQLGFTGDHPLAAHVETANAIDRAYSLLKNQCLGQALEGVSLNARYGVQDVRLFEFTRTFHPDPTADNGVCTERGVLWALASGTVRDGWDGAAQPADGAWMRGLVEEMAVALRRPWTFGPVDEAQQPLATALHPGRRLAILVEGRPIGLLGEVHPAVKDAFKLKKRRPVYLEIDAVAIEADGAPWSFVEPPRVPPVERSLAFVLPTGPDGVGVGAVDAVLRTSGGEALAELVVTDRFEPDADHAVWTWALRWRNDDGDVTAEALNEATERAATAVLDALGARGVSRRA